MYAVALSADADAAAFRAAAKRCLASDLAPGAVTFSAGAPSLLPPPPGDPHGVRPSISRALGDLIDAVSAHRASDRFDLLYGLLWRYVRGEKSVLEMTTDPSVLKAMGYERSVRRDIHKMHAFLRFRESEQDGKPFFSAWFEPQHHILKAALPFFTGRFGSMNWMIASPDASAVWRDGELTYGPGAPRPSDSDDAVLDTLWNTYYRAIFNPARLHVDAMLREMPKRYWRDMPETDAIASMLRTAEARTGAMAARDVDTAPRFADRVAARHAARVSAEVRIAAGDAGSLISLKAEAARCSRCPLHAHATQTVFGEGPADAALMFVGEQPGDQEDLDGRPFAGPAGRLFDKALDAAGIDRARAYVTNAVKHFKFEPRGKRRIHQRPDAGEVQACRWWLRSEIDLIRPQLIVALGATATLSLTGRPVPVTKARGRVHDIGGQPVFITVHPSYLLRLPDRAVAEREFASFVADLTQAREALATLTSKAA